jgi:tRNA(Ser,Leu) C12 N-acetylase TAN1
MKDWNVVATTRERHFGRAVQLLKQMGTLEKTHFYDVVVLKVDNVGKFLDRLHARLAEEPEIGEWLGHVAPCTDSFTFQSPQEFDEKGAEVVQKFVPQLASKRFHVRMHRRGFKDKLHATEEEQTLDVVLLQALEEAGAPGEITFDDPDAIVAVETVDVRAGLALWTREDLRRYPLLHLD